MMKKIYNNIGIILLLGSCNLNSSTCIVVSLSKEELSWFKDYKDGETRLYKNQFGDIDTLHLMRVPKVSTSTCNRLELSEFQYESIQLNFDQLGANFSKKKGRVFNILFSKEQQRQNDHDCKKDIWFQDLGTGTILDIKKIEKKADTLLLTNKVIYPYHFSEETNLDKDGTLTRYRSFDVHQKYGLVKYENKKGEVYKYWKKI